jgi:twitching motility protein PilT
MVAILEQINKTRKEHIVTIEDPIEFIFENKLSIISQRELWRDTKSFHSALRASMREDPDVIMVWEMRDKETVEAALELAETWHLVISTLHTSSAAQSIIRLLSFFPPETQSAIWEKIASSLAWILSQRLIPRVDQNWRVWIYELMIANTWISNQIRMWKISQMQSSIETWAKDWMITMKKFADDLEQQWIIKKEDYMNYFKDDTEI